MKLIQIISKDVKRALDFAEEAHRGQLRKHTFEPYIVHPIEVAEIVWDFTLNEAATIAALLHDVVEDTHVTLGEVQAKFGDEISTLVESLTDCAPSSSGNRAKRSAINLEHTAKSSPLAKTIKLADIMSNVPSIVKYDPKFAVVYLKEKMAQLVVLGDGDKDLFRLVSDIVKQGVAQLERDRLDAALAKMS